VRIVGAQPQEGSRIPGIRKWPEAYLPKIYDPSGRRAGLRQPGRRRGHGAPPGARGGPVRRHLGRGRLLGGAAAGAAAENATIVFIVCDRGDRYLSTGVFPA
jgi:cysteine synthase B